MTIASEITRINGNITDAYTAASNKGATLPATQNSDNLAMCISSIPSGYTELSSYQVSNGVANRRSSSLIGNEFSDITSIGGYGLNYAFYGCSGLTGNLDLSSVTSVEYGGLSYAFYNCIRLTSVDLSSLTSVPGSGLNYAFSGCTALTSVDLSSLTTVENYGLNYAFYNSYGLTGNLDLSALTTVGQYGLSHAFSSPGLTSVNLSSLTTVGNNGLNTAFNACGFTSVNLSSLTTVGQYGLSYAFVNCTALENVYFNSLTTTSFGSSTNQFSYMLNNTGTTVTHTLHFPSNLESTIQGLTGYPNFGGTSGYVTLAFDLTATS